MRFEWCIERRADDSPSGVTSGSGAHNARTVKHLARMHSAREYDSNDIYFMNIT